ncbi:MAG: isopenicillin N synthase family dioxygenase [Gammaproteobacteria bacterium]
MSNTLDTGVDVRKISNATPGLSSKRPAFTEIPIIDFSAMRSANDRARRSLAQDVLRACTEVGFFYVKHHGVPHKAIDRLLAASREFFSQDTAEKMKIDIAKSSFSRGYIPLYGEKNNEHSKGDIKETFDVAIDIDEHDPDYLAGNPLYGPNQWPQNLPHFKDDVQDFFSEITDLCAKLYRTFALALNLPEDYFLGMLDKPLDILRLLRYPPQPRVEDEDQIGTGAHSDFDCFTVLYQDPTGGLQVLNNRGVWIDALPVEGTFLINVGDMLERWTNGQFVSTVHRVINRSHSERCSTVFFAAPGYDTEVECLPSCCSAEKPAKYPPIKAGDYILSRYEAVLAGS